MSQKLTPACINELQFHTRVTECCEAPFHTGDNFCRNCGEQLFETTIQPKTCTKCKNTHTTWKNKYCPICGRKLPSEPNKKNTT